MAWRAEPFDLPSWWASYALQRYGAADPGAAEAWSILGRTVYGRTQEAKSMYGEKARDGLLSYMWSGPEEAPQVSSRHARPTSVTSNDSCLFRHVRARSERESGESGGATAVMLCGGERECERECV